MSGGSPPRRLLALHIEADVPSLETADATAIGPNGSGDDIDALGSVMIDGDDMAIVALQQLGRSRQDAVSS